MATPKAVTEYRVKKLEEAVQAVHDRFDKHEERQDEQFEKMFKSLSKIDNRLGKMQVELEWTKKIALGVGAVSGFVGGIFAFMAKIKMPF